MARKAIYQHATQVNLGTYPDDGTSPVGSAEWNEALDTGGMLGFLPATANSSTIIIASGVATITDSVSVIAGEGAATDTLQKLALTNTSQYDLVYLFAASSGYVEVLTCVKWFPYAFLANLYHHIFSKFYLCVKTCISPI